MRVVIRRVLPCLILCACIATLGTRASASGPAFWTVANATEFLRGQSDGVYVSLAGVVSAGPQLTNRLTSTPAQIWSLAAAGDTLWAGTGGDGKVLRLRTGQPEETVFDSDEANVFAIAVSGNRVFAATGPDGKVYVIENGAARMFFDPTEKYIWALAVDGSGRLWVGAGNPAVIYRVDASGANQVVYRPPAAHVVTLVADRNGRMLAGTESPGRLYRFESDDRPFVMLDSGLTELRAIAPAPGTTGVVFAAAVARGDEPASSAGETASVGFAAPPAPPGTAPSTPSGSRKSIVFRIEANGVWEAIWESGDVVYDLAATTDGGVLAASGSEGRLYRIERNREVLLLTGVDAKQITRFAGTAESPVFATANPGRVFSTGSRIQSPASYISAVRDTKSVSKWGILRWESTGAVALYTRSGNTEKPDDSWSNWDGPYARKEGDPIKSPAARFLQWRAVLTQTAGSAVAQLTSVTAAYLPSNNRPLVISITAPPPGVVFQRPFSSEEGAIAGLDDMTADARRPPGDPGPPTPSPGRRMFQKGLQTITWKAEDGDADHLSYALQYRREGEQAWRDLRRGLTDPIFVWDTTSVADGRYILKVLASDDPSNAADRALVGERESDPIDVDNTPPTLTTEILRSGGSSRLVIRVHDARSAIQKVEYSLGGAAWQIIYPIDKVADAPDEQYEIPLQSDADAARIVLRVFDVLQNVTSQPAIVR